MKLQKTLKISVYDNERSADRYTVVIEIGQLQDFYAMSARPNEANGVNMFVGSNGESVRWSPALKKGKHLGQNIGWDGAPDAVKAAIIEHLKGY